MKIQINHLEIDSIYIRENILSLPQPEWHHFLCLSISHNNLSSSTVLSSIYQAKLCIDRLYTYRQAMRVDPSK